jgi:hypothetical protein
MNVCENNVSDLVNRVQHAYPTLIINQLVFEPQSAYAC